MKANQLPKDYTPYKLLNICSNEMIDGGVFIQFKDSVPLLVGKGDKPRIWLSGIRDAQSGHLIPIIVDSESRVDKVVVVQDEEKTTVSVTGTTILEVIANGDEARITKLDLRPIGLDVHGKSEGLKIGKGSFSGNKFINVGTMIHLS